MTFRLPFFCYIQQKLISNRAYLRLCKEISTCEVVNSYLLRKKFMKCPAKQKFCLSLQSINPVMKYTPTHLLFYSILSINTSTKFIRIFHTISSRNGTFTLSSHFTVSNSACMGNATVIRRIKTTDAVYSGTNTTSNSDDSLFVSLKRLI